MTLQWAEMVLQKAGYHKHEGMPWWHPMDRKHKAGKGEESISTPAPTVSPARQEPPRAPEVRVTDTSRRVFEAYARDAKNWAGTPLVGGNLGGSEEERGNLTQLKRAGLITTQVDGNDVWITFTEAGKRYAAHLGIDLEGRSTPAPKKPTDQGRRWGAPGVMQKPWTLAGKPMPGAKE